MNNKRIDDHQSHHKKDLNREYIAMPKDEPHWYTYRDPNILRLSRADQKVFANALINPPAPNQKLLEAFERYRKTKKGRQRSAAAFLRSFAKSPKWLKQCWVDAKRSSSRPFAFRLLQRR